MDKIKRSYVAPLLTVVRFKQEKGFAASLALDSDYADNDDVEDRNDISGTNGYLGGIDEW